MEDGARRILELLDESVPSPRRGSRLLDQALEQAGLESLPETTPELRAFVRRSLLPVLTEELGPRLADEVVGDLEVALSPALRRIATQPASPSSMRMQKVSVSIPPSSMPPSSVRARAVGRAVLVLGSDRFATATLARALLGTGFTVTSAYDQAELANALAIGSLDAIVTDEALAIEHALLLREALRLERRSVLIVTGCRDPQELEKQLQDEHGGEQVFGLSSSASSRELVAALARATL